MSNLVQHAKQEIKRAGLDTTELYDGMLSDAVMELVKVFAKQGHSGYSAALTLRLFDDLASYRTLSRITSDPKEWRDVSEHTPGEKMWQNKRDSRFFSRDEGKTWYSVEKEDYMKPNYAYEGKVTRVVDGDSVIVEADLGFQVKVHKADVRFLGINAPAMRDETTNQPSEAGLASRRHLIFLLTGAEGDKLEAPVDVTVKLARGTRDKWRRWLADIYLDGMHINGKMVEDGHAEPMAAAALDAALEEGGEEKLAELHG